MHPPPFSHEALLEHTSALRRLARSLVRDAATAEDLVQTTFAKALERAPERVGSLRAWLARVMRNAAHEERRGAERRAARELAAASEEARPSTAELVERFDGRMAVARAVRELEEPYREAILLRYFEDLPPRAIAARLGLSVKSVDSRIHRGLARLRSALEREHDGDWRAWCALLLPLARGAAPSPWPIGGLLMNAKLVGAVSVVALAAGLFLVWRALQVEVAPALSARSAVLHDVTARGATPLPAGAPEATRAASAVGTPAGIVAPPEIEGRALDVSGRAAAGVRLAWTTSAREESGGTLTTDADGGFRVPLEPPLADVRCADERYVAVLDHQDQGDQGPTTPIVVVAPRGEVAGVVLDDARAPVAGAEVALELPEDYRARLAADLSATRSSAWITLTDGEGAFRFYAAPRVEGLACRARKAGYADGVVVVDDFGAHALELVLERPGSFTVLEGIVVDELSAPVAGARVALGLLPTTSDADGRFRFEFDAGAPPERLMAVARGALPAVLERGTDAWPPFVELRLGGAPLAIRGVVLGSDGEPLPAAEVWIDESTVLASWSGGFWVAENTILERSELQIRTLSDAHGRFVLEGLIEREYGLHAMDPARAWQVAAGSFPAGSEEVVIRFEASGLHARLAGRLVDRDGGPVQGAGVTVETSMLAARDPAGHAYYNGRTGASATSDEQGRFVLTGVPRAQARLHVHGKEIAFDQEHPVPESAEEPLVLVVARRCELRVERPAGAATACTFGLLDAAGEPVALTRREVGRIDAVSRAPLADGCSEVLSAPDTAVALAFYDEEGHELRRMPVRLRAGEPNVIR